MPDHVYSTIDTSQTYTFRQSPWQMLGLLLLAALMTALSGLVAFGWIDGRRGGGFMMVIGYAGLVFFGLGLVLIAWRIVNTRGPVLKISPAGIRDTRVAAEPIPWAAINGVGTWSAHKQSFLIVAVDPAVERTIRQTRISRWTRSANRAIGADGLFIATTGLDLDHEDLKRLVLAFLPDRPDAESDDPGDDDDAGDAI